MHSAMLFGRDPVVSQTIERLAQESGEVSIDKVSYSRVTTPELSRMLLVFHPDLVFLELDPFDEALVLAKAIREMSGHTAIIGFRSGEPLPADLRPVAASAVEHVLPSPPTREGVWTCVELALRRMPPAIHDGLLALVPAKAGSGASTVAVHLAGALARDCGSRVLLLDADLHSGIVAMLLGIRPEFATVQALEHSRELDTTLWSKVVTPIHGFDVVATARPGPPGGANWSQYRRLLKFALPSYDAVMVDLPEVINDATEEVVRRAGRILLVTTAELPALALAGQRCQALQARGVSAERIRVVINRWRRELETNQIQDLVGAPVYFALPSDYPAVRQATQEGCPLTARSELGQSFQALAQRLTGQKPAARSIVGGLLGSWKKSKDVAVRT
jgi:pilus assembly protein CpaE